MKTSHSWERPALGALWLVLMLPLLSRAVIQAGIPSDIPSATATPEYGSSESIDTLWVADSFNHCGVRQPVGIPPGVLLRSISANDIGAEEDSIERDGVRYRRLGQVPVLTNRQVAILATRTASNAVIRCAVEPGQRQVLSLSAHAAAAEIVALDPESAEVVATGTGTIEWTGGNSPVVLFIGTPSPSTFEAKSIDVTETHAALRKMLETFPELPGVAVAAQDPGFLPVILAEGHASAETHQPLTGTESFHIASISKTFTAAAIFVLQQQGRLNITNAIAGYVPELNVPLAADITVEQLLQHRSGLPDANNTAWVDGQREKNLLQEFSVEEIVSVARHLYPDQVFEPGTDYLYSDTGYNILARIIENVSGTNYQAFVQAAVLDPLGLAHTFAPGNHQIAVPEPALHAYSFLDGVFTNTTQWNPSVEVGCGSLVSTLPDLLAAAAGLFRTTNVLSAASQALMMDPVSTAGLHTCGRGCNVMEGIGWGHDGAGWGVISCMRMDTDTGVCLSGAFNVQYDDERLYASFFQFLSSIALLKNALGYPAAAYGTRPPQLLPILPPTRQNREFRAQPIAFNFPTNWHMENLPAGLSCDPASGEITGRTTERGTHSITVTAQNAYGCITETLILAVQTDYAETITAVSNHIVTAMAEEGTVGVSIALVDHDDIVWAQGFGYADLEAGIPVDTSTVFRIGSVSKAFTTALALQYAERGLLDIASPFTTYTPAVTWKERFPSARAITVQDLMTHHSGLPGDLVRTGFLTNSARRGYLDVTADLAKTYPVFEPGTVQNYCNSAFVLLEGIIEAAATAEGDFRSFDQLATARLFDILHMDATSFYFDKPDIIQHLAIPYAGGQRMPPEYVELLGTGGLYSRPTDMARFMRTFFADTPNILRPETRARMTADQSTNAIFDIYKWPKSGLGWDTVTDPRLAYAGPAVWKNGGTVQYSAQFFFLPEKKLGVAIASSSPSSIPMTADVLTLQHALQERDGIPIPTNPVVWPTHLAAITQSELDALAGVYIGSANYDIIESHPGSLTYRSNVPDNALTINNLRLRDDGWFLSDDTPHFAIAFTNAHGRDLMLYRVHYGASDVATIRAERFDPVPIPPAWSNRLGRTWLARNTSPDDYFRLLGATATLQLACDDNILRVVSGGLNADRVIAPVSDTLAWVPGLVNRGDSAVQVIPLDGTEHLLYEGIIFGPEPAEIPATTGVTNAITTEHLAQWYEIQPAPPPSSVGTVSNIHYQVILAGAPTNFLLRVFEPDTVTLVAERMGNGILDLDSADTPLLLRIQPGSSGEQTGSYQMTFSIPLLIRELTLTPTHAELIWQGITEEMVTIETATDLTQENPFVPAAADLVFTNLLMRQWIDLDASNRFFRIRRP